MPANFDSLSQLEVLLLVLVKAEFATPYDLLTRLGIGVGTSSPALKRLAKAGLLTITSGPRNRMRFAITEEGEKRLKNALNQGPPRYWKHGDRDTFDSLRRLILLAWIDHSLPGAVYCVNQAKIELEELFDRRIRRAVHLRGKVLQSREIPIKGEQVLDDARLIAYVSGWIEATFDALQFESQINALTRVLGLIGELPTPPQIWPNLAGSAESPQEHTD
jgi:DNA-binding PadR family transcriptional regulator